MREVRRRACSSGRQAMLTSWYKCNPLKLIVAHDIRTLCRSAHVPITLRACLSNDPVARKAPKGMQRGRSDGTMLTDCAGVVMDRSSSATRVRFSPRLSRRSRRARSGHQHPRQPRTASSSSGRSDPSGRRAGGCQQACCRSSTPRSRGSCKQQHLNQQGPAAESSTAACAHLADHDLGQPG